MSADVAWMAYQTTVGGLQPDKMVPCRSVTDTRPSPKMGTPNTTPYPNPWMDQTRVKVWCAYAQSRLRDK